jgi:lipopolysaccharide heptosyltransferase I
MNVLIVRLGALGDVVHTIPAAAALRRAFPAAAIDWLVEARHRPIVDLVSVVDRAVVLERATVGGWIDVSRVLRRTSYDIAIDFQGLLKSAVLARASGAARVVGFSIWHLREKSARPFYSAAGSADADHVIRKNLHLLRAIGIEDDEVRFPLMYAPSAAMAQLQAQLPAGRAFALVNPGAAWPNKRWPAERYGEVASFLHDACGLTPVVIWGPGEDALANAVKTSSSNTAVVAPPTGVADLVALSRAAALVVSGDTGPLHIATAVGTPTVSLFGPTDPGRNGPWIAADIAISRYDRCGCHYERRCRRDTWCLSDVTTSEVCAAIQRRMRSVRANA